MESQQETQQEPRHFKSNGTVVVAPEPPSRAKTVGMSVLESVGVMAVFFVMQSLGMILATFALAIIMNYNDYSAAGINRIIAENAGFVSLTCQIAEFIALAIIWVVMRRRSIMRAKAAHVSYAGGAGNVILRVIAIAVLGIVLQVFLTGALASLVNFVPAISDAYNELVNMINTNLGGELGQISATFGAPLVEELFVRGIFFELMLRIFQGDFAVWREESYPQRGCKPQLAPTTGVAAFWIANVLQALLFGVIHLNLIQGSYAFVLGLLLGWVYWRTGKLRYSMLLHLAVNGSSLFVDSVLNGLGLATEVPLLIITVVTLVLAVVIVCFFGKKTKPQE